MAELDDIMTAAPVIPVLVIERAEDALPIAQALVEGGLPVLEVTLRTPAALDAIRAMKSVPGAIVGAGTVLTERQYQDACDAGSEFVVSPGLTDSLAKAVTGGPAPLLPGVATATEVMLALEHGFRRMKFFPATAAGGPSALTGLSSVFRDVRFCPTGGITLQNAPEWLAIPSVLCVGGTWLVPAGQEGDTDGIRNRARHAAQLRR